MSAPKRDTIVQDAEHVLCHRGDSCYSPDMTSMADILKSNPLFASLDEEALGQLVSIARQRSVPAATTLFLQGDPGDAVFGISSGQVRISVDSPTGATRHLNLLGPGDLFGEIALLDGGTRTASATTVLPSQLAVIERGPFIALVNDHPGLSLQLLTLVCARVRWTSGLVEDAAFLPGPARLAKRLLGLTRLAGSQGDVRISQATLASLSGLSRQVVNRQLGEWSDHGYLRTARGVIRVLDESALDEIAGRWSD
jgi:CRP-like cAMP-binding protein